MGLYLGMYSSRVSFEIIEVRSTFGNAGQASAKLAIDCATDANDTQT